MVSIFYHTFSDAEIQDQAFEQLKKQLPKWITDKAARFRQVEDQYRCLVGKGLLAFAHEEVTSQELNWTDYLQEDLHKPKLNNGPFFNISHSGNVVVVAISDICEVGIDIEEVKPIDIDSFQGNFQPTEWSWLQNASNKLKMLRFYQLWTRKEAILKGTGKGLSLPLTSFSVMNENVHVLGKPWYLLNLSLTPDAVCSLAIDQALYHPTDLRTQKCELNEFLNPLFS